MPQCWAPTWLSTTHCPAHTRGAGLSAAGCWWRSGAWWWPVRPQLQLTASWYMALRIKENTKATARSPMMGAGSWHEALSIGHTSRGQINTVSPAMGNWETAMHRLRNTEDTIVKSCEIERQAQRCIPHPFQRAGRLPCSLAPALAELQSVK